MSDMSPERRKVAVLCALVATMSSGPILLKGHPVLAACWIAAMLVILVIAMARLAKLKRQGL